jgi:hypothetical protein
MDWSVMKRLALFSVGLLALSGAAFAADDPVTMRGLGAMSCPQYLAARKEQGMTPNKATFNQWAQGFMTGLNVALYMKHHRYVDLPDSDSMNRSFTAYCSANPAKPFHEAVSALMVEASKSLESSPGK